MSTFLDGVNRVLRINSVIADDDDDITTFNDVQHKAALNMAIIAIQGTLTDLVSCKFIPYEEAESTITYVNGTRIYALASDFVRFAQGNDYFLKIDGSGNSENQRIYPYPKGENQLRNDIMDYREQTGDPTWWYFANGSTKRVGFYYVPDSTVDGDQLRYYYEKSVYVETETDTMPFTTQQEDDTFFSMAARYFQFLFTKQPIEGLENDVIYKKNKVSLAQLMRVDYGSKKYGFTYK